MDPARGSDEQISAMTAALMKLKTHVTMKLVLPLEYCVSLCVCVYVCVLFS
jgi:hypothetical protein